MRLTKDDNHDIGFARWCLASEAISKEEFRQWILHVIEVVDDPPPYVFDLVDFDGYLTDLVKIMPFTPDWAPTQSEISAISGIAISRGVTPYEPVNEKTCLQALSENPSINDWFFRLFPFIDRNAEQVSGGNGGQRR